MLAFVDNIRRGLHYRAAGRPPFITLDVREKLENWGYRTRASAN